MFDTSVKKLWRKDESSSPPAIRRHALIGKPQPFGWRPRLPKDVDRDAAARIPVTADTQPAGPHFIEQAAADADGAILVKARMIAEGIGRATRRETVLQYGKIPVVAA